MSLEDTKKRGEDVYAAYEALVAEKRLGPLITSELAPSFIDRITASVSKVFKRSENLKPSEAIRCLRAAMEVTKTLLRATGDDRKAHEYTLEMANLLNELTDVIAKDWGTRDYEPLTLAMQRGKERLAKVKKDADDLAKNLGIAADLLTAFGKYIGALKAS